LAILEKVLYHASILHSNAKYFHDSITHKNISQREAYTIFVFASVTFSSLPLEVSICIPAIKKVTKAAAKISILKNQSMLSVKVAPNI
jgi:hypothetical protein